MLVQSDQEKEVRGLSIYVGDQINREETSVTNVQYRLAGKTAKVTNAEAQKVELFGIGTHLRFVFDGPDQRSGQVSLKSIRVWGQKLDFHEGIVNHEMPPLNELSSADIDRLILEQGMSLEGSAFDGLTVDEETAITIREIEDFFQQNVLDGGDYAKLEEVKTDLGVLKSDVSSKTVPLISLDNNCGCVGAV